VNPLKRKLTVKLLFAVTQSILALSALVLAVLLKFNLFSAQLFFGISSAILNFYVVFLIVFGVIFLVSSLLLIYDWLELR